MENRADSDQTAPPAAFTRSTLFVWVYLSGKLGKIFLKYQFRDDNLQSKMLFFMSYQSMSVVCGNR